MGLVYWILCIGGRWPCTNSTGWVKNSTDQVQTQPDKSKIQQDKSKIQLDKSKQETIPKVITTIGNGYIGLDKSHPLGG